MPNDSTMSRDRNLYKCIDDTVHDVKWKYIVDVYDRINCQFMLLIYFNVNILLANLSFARAACRCFLQLSSVFCKDFKLEIPSEL